MEAGAYVLFSIQYLNTHTINGFTGVTDPVTRFSNKLDIYSLDNRFLDSPSSEAGVQVKETIPEED